MNKKCLLIMPALFLFFLGVNQAWGYSSYVSNIPNGSAFSCTNCHTTSSGGPTNWFGEDFASHSHVWGASLAAIDSDGDTFTNGTELQDPNGTWVKGQPAPGNPALVTNPGDSASRPATTYSISGIVTVSGSGLSGVSMTLTGTSLATVTTDTSGNYTFSGLSNGNYTVTPSKAGYAFAPTSIAVTISGANQEDKNFTATATGTTCSVWNDVITEYNAYVSGLVNWSDVITCYTQYTSRE
jgi:hypothetical protein